MPYYIGVDGGGTKTAYALFDERKELLRLHKGPGTNHENLEGSFDEAARLLWEGVQALLREAGLAVDGIAFAFMGLAGVDHPFQYEALMGRLQGFGLTRLEIVNDGFIVVKAGCRSGAGIGLNLGTGTCCNAIDRRGRRAMLAGLGEFSGDIGNGEWIAQQAFKCAYDDCILGIEASAVTPLIFSKFDLEQPGDLLSLLDGREITKTLIDVFFEAVNAGDPPAMRLAQQMARRGAQLIAAHLRALDFDDPCEVVLSGSMHTRLPCEVYVGLLKQKAQALSGRALVFRKLDVPPVTGCVNWIMEEYAG